MNGEGEVRTNGRAKKKGSPFRAILSKAKMRRNPAEPLQGISSQ
jgi:hypothetical protein